MDNDRTVPDDGRAKLPTTRPFDTKEYRTEQSAEEIGKRFVRISAHEPMPAARVFVEERYRKADLPTLWRWRGLYYEWRGGFYREIEEARLRTEIYHFLERNRAPARAKIVSEVLDALRSICHLDADAVDPPAWLDYTPDFPDPSECIVAVNGIWHLPSGQQLKPTPLLFALNGLDFPFDPKAPDPTEWLRFLGTLWPKDPESIATLQQIFGYNLVADTRHHKIFLVIGPPRAGKGTIARVLQKCLGRGNYRNPTLTSLSQRFGLAPLIGASCAIISDARLGGHTDQRVIVERLLSISGADHQTVERKHLPDWNGPLKCRFLIFSNEAPRLSDASRALPSRFLGLRLTESFLNREDQGLQDRLDAELPGILRWAADGHAALVAAGRFVQPQSAKSLLGDIEESASPISAFLEDRCAISPEFEVGVGELYRVWCAWCEERGRRRPGTLESLGRELRAALPTIETVRAREDGRRIRRYRGLAITPP